MVKGARERSEGLYVSRVIIVYKFILGLVELVLGVGTLLFGKQIYLVYQNFRSQELLEDAHDLLGDILEKIMPYLFQHRGYVILVLILLGVVKVVGAVGLWYRKHWGYDLLVGLTLVLLPFELYSFLRHITVMSFSYLAFNILIALYLVNFKPKQYFNDFKRRVSS